MGSTAVKRCCDQVISWPILRKLRLSFFHPCNATWNPFVMLLTEMQVIYNFIKHILTYISVSF